MRRTGLVFWPLTDKTDAVYDPKIAGCEENGSSLSQDHASDTASLQFSSTMARRARASYPRGMSSCALGTMSPDAAIPALAALLTAADRSAPLSKRGSTRSASSANACAFSIRNSASARSHGRERICFIRSESCLFDLLERETQSPVLPLPMLDHYVWINPRSWRAVCSRRYSPVLLRCFARNRKSGACSAMMLRSHSLDGP